MSEGVKRISPPLGLKEELIVPEIEQRNWKGILISLLVIASICSLILLSILLLSPHFGDDGKHDKLGLDEILLHGYKRKGYNGSWLSDRELIYMDDNKTLFIYDVDTKYRNVLADYLSMKTIAAIKSYSVSADRRYVLFSYDVLRTGSHSYTSKYKIYDMSSTQAVPLRMPDMSEDLQYAGWGPNANQLIVIHRNNIYLFFRADDENPIQITSNGRPGTIYNGIPDLVYEEHILETNLAFWWLNDGSRFCYASFDNQLVDQMPYVLYDDKNSSFQSESIGVITSEDDYPKVYVYPYSKPGREIPKVSLHISEVKSPNYAQTIAKITPPDEIRNQDHYLTAPITWLNSSAIVVIWSRRSQNYTVISICKEENNWRCKKLTEEKLSSPIGWLLVKEAPIFSDDRKYFFIRLPVTDGMFGTYDHIAMIYTEGGKKYFLTHGQFVVTEIFAYRSDLNTVYFAATTPNDPGVRHIYSVTDMNAVNPRKVECLSCNDSHQCWFNNAVFSPNGKYYISECLGPDIPRTFLYLVDGNKFIQTLEDNHRLRKWSEERSLPRIKYLTIPMENGFPTRVQMLLPQSLIEDEEIKYPSIIEIDNRPGGQSVSYEHRLDWSRYLSSKKDYISIHLDVRGSGFQGHRYEFEVFHHLGDAETADLVSTINKLKKMFPYIDEDKIVVWGRDYGGFLTTSLLAQDNSITCAIAVSPISSWKNYLSVFSERYMGLPFPNDNYLNYEKTDLTRDDLIEKLKQKTFLIVHGTADKRVNIHHSMLLMKKLTEHSVQFKVQLYPDSGVMESWDLLVRLHFYRTMEDFFAKCFQVEEDAEEDLLPITRVLKGVQLIEHLIGPDNISFNYYELEVIMFLVSTIKLSDIQYENQPTNLDSSKSKTHNKSSDAQDGLWGIKTL